MGRTTPVNYFCYGSNLCRENFKTRNKGFSGRQIEYDHAQVAVLKDWALAFNAYFCPPAEPVMASIEEEPGSEVHGMLYEISDPESWDTLVDSEGGRGMYYRQVEVIVEIEGGRCVRAVTFEISPLYYVPKGLRAYVRPSARYLKIILDGAEKEKLNVAVGQLKSVKSARKANSALQALGLSCVIWMMYASDNWLRPTMQPYTFLGTRLFYAKEKLAEEKGIGSSAAYYAVSLAHLMLILFYFSLGMLRIPLDGTVRRKVTAMAKKMLK